MSDVYAWHEGTTPLLISIPHDGRGIPPDIAARMTAAGRSMPDTDWHVRQLYALARPLGANIIAANYSRYVVDLNRSAADEPLYAGQLSTGLCPAQTFAGEAIYQDGQAIADDERRRRVALYWEPYHARLGEALAAIRRRHGHACLWDAHSIRGTVPRLFPGTLPDLNIGTNDGRSCPAVVQGRIADVAAASPHSSVVNGRFKGGYITRHYGKPDDRVYAVQLELAQRCYMDEATLRYDAERAAMLGKTIERMLAAFVEGAGTGS